MGLPYGSDNTIIDITISEILDPDNAWRKEGLFMFLQTPSPISIPSQTQNGRQ